MSAGGSSVAIIPARGGSAGIPRKNLRKVGGVPLIVRAIRACTISHRIDLTVVSTDDPEIAELSRAEGATVITRPAELATGQATSESAVLHALEELRERRCGYPAWTVLVQCTSPFLEGSDLDRLVDVLASGTADSCFLAARSHRFLWRVGSNGAATAVNHDMSRRLLRQELEPEFVEAGAAYGFRTEGFLSNRNRFFGRVVLVELDPARALEIDDPSDPRPPEGRRRTRRSIEGPEGVAHISAVAGN